MVREPIGTYDLLDQRTGAPEDGPIAVPDGTAYAPVDTSGRARRPPGYPRAEILVPTEGNSSCDAAVHRPAIRKPTVAPGLSDEVRERTLRRTPRGGEAGR